MSSLVNTKENQQDSQGNKDRFHQIRIRFKRSIRLMISPEEQNSFTIKRSTILALRFVSDQIDFV